MTLGYRPVCPTFLCRIYLGGTDGFICLRATEDNLTMSRGRGQFLFVLLVIRRVEWIDVVVAPIKLGGIRGRDLARTQYMDSMTG